MSLNVQCHPSATITEKEGLPELFSRWKQDSRFHSRDSQILTGGCQRNSNLWPGISVQILRLYLLPPNLTSWRHRNW